MNGLPEWANWIATEESGAVYIYRDKPCVKACSQVWNRDSIERVEFLNDTKPNPNWRDSLRRIKRIRHGAS